MCNRTMRRERKKSASVYIVAAVILMCYLAQTIDCYRLRKTGRRDGQRQADTTKTIGIQEGRILFGIDFQTGSQNINDTKKSNASVEDEVAYQADSTGWAKGQTHDTRSKDASWRHMAPSLQCGGDHLKFKAVGPGSSYFAVDQGIAQPMPLSQVPATCGYNMQRNSLGLNMLVSYDGCNMVQQGGSYVLPMHWQGIPVSLWCPKPASPAAPTPQPQTPPQVPHYPWQPGSFPMFPLPLPVTKPPSTTAKPATAPRIPFFYPPFPIYWPLPTTAKPQTTTTTAKPQLPQHPMFVPYPQVPIHSPQSFYPFNFFYPMFPTAKPQTTKPTTTTMKTPPHHVPFPLPHIPPIPPYHPLYHHFVYPTAKPTTTTPTTTTTTTTAKVNHHHPLHIHPPPFGFPVPIYSLG